MSKCEECKMFRPALFICPTLGRLVKVDTDASMCKMEVSKCGDCSMFEPNLFNCTGARIAGKRVDIQVNPSTLACEAFMPKEKN